MSQRATSISHQPSAIVVRRRFAAHDGGVFASLRLPDRADLSDRQVSAGMLCGVRRPAHNGDGSDRGVALILTLAILALVTLLLIAFVTSMRVENAASKNFNNLIKARELAQGAIDQAVAQIRLGTPLRTQSPLFTYVTFPGAIYTNYLGFIGSISLSSPINSSYPATISGTNLNDHFWITGSNTLEYANLANSAINVGWVYVDENGSLSSSSSTLSKPVIGRFAYWVDDEASKINVNTAGTTTVCSDPMGICSDPSDVDLSMLQPGPPPFLYASDVQSGGATYPRATDPYTTIEEIKRANVLITNVFNDNQFYLTAYSDDQNDLDAFDRPRLDMTQLTEAKDITDTVGTLSAYARLSDSSLTRIYGPAVNKGFDLKYGQNGLKQIIANVIAYQQDPRAGQYPPDAGGDPPAYLGLAKVPYVNEVKVNYDTIVSAGGTQVVRTVSVELYYPYGADGSSYTTGPASAPDTIDVRNLPALDPLPTTAQTLTLTSLRFDSGTAYRSFDLATDRYLVSSSHPYPTVPVPTANVIVDYRRSGHRLDYALAPVPTIVLSPSVPSRWQGAEVNDPCVNESTAAWTPYRFPTAGTLGAPNSAYAPPGGDASKMVMRGNVTPAQSVGELGYIHQPPTIASPNQWQYLHLQPQPSTEQKAKVIPDWAILDIFTVPNAKTAGRMNINGLLTAAPPLPTATRLIPLNALLSGLDTLLGFTASGQVQKDIYGDKNRSVSDTYGMGVSSTMGVFDTIGEVCEISSLAGNATTEDGKEAAIRRIAGMITTRSNAFTIWVVAQSIKQPGGRLTIPLGQFDPSLDVITGDVKAEAVVERYENPPGTVPKYRLRYFRYLYN